jgi:hypothetical protein
MMLTLVCQCVLTLVECRPRVAQRSTDCYDLEPLTKLATVHSGGSVLWLPMTCVHTHWFCWRCLLNSVVVMLCTCRASDAAAKCVDAFVGVTATGVCEQCEVHKKPFEFFHAKRWTLHCADCVVRLPEDYEVVPVKQAIKDTLRICESQVYSLISRCRPA